MSRGKDIALVITGILTGIIISNPAAWAGLMADPSTQQFCLDGEPIDLEAYSINGANYVKLRDIGQTVDFGVTYDAATNTVHIEPDQPYAEEVSATTTETGAVLTNGKPVSEENVLELLRQIQRDWPAGTAWGTRTTPGTFKNEVPGAEAARVMVHYSVNGTYGCCGYAAMVSSLIFGDRTNPCRQLDDLSQIRPGDMIFMVNNATGKLWHVKIALETPDEVGAFHYTDGNHGERIYWPDDPYGKESLGCYQGENASYRLEVWTRYPESVPCTGSSVNAWAVSNG